MSAVKTIRLVLIIATAVYCGLLVAFLVYSIASNFLGGPYTIVRGYFASFVGLIAWSTTSLLVGSFLDTKSRLK